MDGRERARDCRAGNACRDEAATSLGKSVGLGEPKGAPVRGEMHRSGVTGVDGTMGWWVL